METKSRYAHGTEWRGTQPDWDLQSPWVHHKGVKLRPVESYAPLGYRIADKEREPGEDG